MAVGLIILRFLYLYRVPDADLHEAIRRRKIRIRIKDYEGRRDLTIR
jgi:hypothetical protein